MSGQVNYPKWTSHFNRKLRIFLEKQCNTWGLTSALTHTAYPIALAVIFNRSHFWLVIFSDIGVILALVVVWSATCIYGFKTVFMCYGVPWVLVHHWIVMITYLHHTDPILPHFRGGTWNFQRGASATIDRDFLGWQGRFFLYDGKRIFLSALWTASGSITWLQII